MWSKKRVGSKNLSKTSWANARVKLHSQVHFVSKKFSFLPESFKKRLSLLNLGLK